ncbi:MAG: UDP-3-O-(3-hydroxymyristoyl)glucosamine N-acyltransferase [Advenella sp.]|nr:UDP-3-O-(3-hydroxymyristoyl)glucosamine N-acyltransferase [Advenella sp.]
MAIVLNQDQAVTLDKLLEQVDTKGLDWQIIKNSNQPLPFILGLGSLNNAGKAEISFLSNAKFFPHLLKTGAAAVILPQKAVDHLPDSVPFVMVVCENPYLLYARIAQWFDRFRLNAIPKQIHPSAIVAPDAHIEEGVSIGPLAVIESNVNIAAGSIIGASCVIGKNTVVGKNSILYANVTLYHDVIIGERCILHSGSVIGADGFGFAPDNTREKGAWCKISQLGRVVLGNDVEIGACTTVDRGAIEDTVIGNGVKLDNQIMIGHNVKVGDHTAMAACVGIAGSTQIGTRCTVAGAGMVSGHITIGDDVHVSGGSAVTSDLLEPGRYTGVFPIAAHSVWQKNAAVLQQLAQLRRRIQQLEKK